MLSSKLIIDINQDNYFNFKISARSKRLQINVCVSLNKLYVIDRIIKADFCLTSLVFIEKCYSQIKNVTNYKIFENLIQKKKIYYRYE